MQKYTSDFTKSGIATESSQPLRTFFTIGGYNTTKMEKLYAPLEFCEGKTCLIPRKMFKKYKAFAAVLAAFCLPGFAGCTASEMAKLCAACAACCYSPTGRRNAGNCRRGQTTVLSADATIRDTTYLSDTNSENALRSAGCACDTAACQSIENRGRCSRRK